MLDGTAHQPPLYKWPIMDPPLPTAGVDTGLAHAESDVVRELKGV